MDIEKKRIVGCYSALGDRPRELPNGISFYHCKNWKNPVMSPYFVLTAKISTKNFLQAESFFKKHPSYFPYDSKHPYLQIFGKKSKKEMEKIISLSHKMGWKKSEQVSTMNVWNKPIPIEIPKGINVKYGNYFDPMLYRPFIKTMRENFSCNNKFISEFNKMIKGIEERIKTIVLFSNTGKIIGAGLVATCDETSFLFCGSICKHYRSRGYWNVLVSSRQCLSRSQGANIWIMTTNNPRIKDKAPFSFPIHTFVKE